MNESAPLVTAIIPTHNRADLLPRALRSVIAQSYSPIEIIVVDDASNDETANVVRGFQEEHKIRYLRNKTSQGAAAARNRGIEAASGKFIAGLDDDDEWHQERIAELVKAYSDEYAFVTSDIRMKFPNGEAVWKKNKIIDLDTLLFNNQVGNQVLVRRDYLLELGGFDTSLDAIEDYDLWVRLCASHGAIRNVQMPLQTNYTDHQKDRITDRDFTGFMQFYQKHKYRMNRAQRGYQLFNIRRSQGKPLTVGEFLSRVPLFRYWSELKHIVIRTFLD